LSDQVEPRTGLRGRKRRRRLALIGIAVVLGVLVLGVILVPAIASSMAPGIIRKAIEDSVKGRATVGRVSLAWFGKQTVGPITVVDEAGRQVAKLDLEASRGLFGLATAGLGAGPMKLGTVRVTGEATVVRFKDGTTNLERLLKDAGKSHSGPGNGGPKKLPRGLDGKISVESFDIHLIDEDGPRQVDLPGLTATASYADGSGIVTLNAPAVFKENGTSRPAGTLKVDASITGLADSSGTLTPSAAVVDATVEAAELSTQVAAILSGLGDRLVVGLGETMRVSATVKGGLSSGDATVLVVSRGLNADIGLKAADGAITTARPGSVQVSGGVVRALTTDAEKSAGFTLETAPDMTVSLDSLRIPGGVGAIDWKQTTALLTVRTTAISGVASLPEQKSRRIDVAPLEAVVDARDPAAGATIKAATSVQLDGAPAGTITVNLIAKEPFSGELPALSGQAELKDLSTAAAQPFVETLGLDLPAGIGPKVDLTIAAAQVDGGRTELDVKVRSSGLNGAAAMSYDGASIVLRSPAEFSLRSPQALAAQALEQNGLRVSEGGFAKVSVRSLSAPISGGGLDKIAADATVSIGGLAVSPASAQDEPVAINQIIIGARLEPGAVPRLTLKASGSHGGGEFFAEGDIEAHGLITTSAGKAALTPAAVRPVGTVRMNNLPTSLATWGGKPATAPGSTPGFDTVRMVRDAVGPSVTVVIDAKAAANNASAVAITATAEHMNGRINADVGESGIAVSMFDIQCAVSPALVASLLDMVGSELETRPALAGPATLIVAIEPFSIPVKDGRLQFSQGGDLSFKAGLEGKTQVTNLIVQDDQGRKRDLGVLGLQDILVKGRWPLAAMNAGNAGEGGPRPAELAISGLVLAEEDQRIAQVTGMVKGSIAGGSVAGDLTANLDLAIDDAARLDSILNQPGLFSGAVGGKLAVKAAGSMRLATGAANSLEQGTVDVSIASPRISTVKPLKATTTGGKLSVESPMILTWNADAAWLNRYVLNSTSPEALRITGSPVFTVKLLKLAIPLGPGVKPMMPGEFLADAEISTPEVSLAAESHATVIKGFIARATGGREPSVIGFSIRADDLGSGPGPDGAPGLLFQGGLYRVADAEGTPTFDTALLSMSGDAHGAPSSIIDAVASQGGWLAEALGPTVDLNVKTEGASKERGTLLVTAHSSRADAELRGVIQAGTFVSEGEPKVTLHAVTPEFGRRMVQGLPLIGTFEKRAEDGPTLITAKNLSVPLNGKVEKFSGEITIDIGTARFETSRLFGAVLRALDQRDKGMVGRKLEPLTLSVKNGVITYPRWKLPLGDFTVDTRGTVDLVNQRLDFITYIPFGALSDEAGGRLNTGLGKLLGSTVPLIERATMVPIHTTGTFDNATTEVDLELFATETGRTLLRPDKLIRDTLQDLFKRDKER
jgi:hypothetical protein